MSGEDLISVRILGREYRLRCAPDERDALLAAAARLDREMRQIQSRSQLIGNERVLLLAALNIAHELVLLQRANDDLRRRLTQQAQDLNRIVTRILQEEDAS
ncbi:cell division protein ZapA [Methylomarinovum caldicuralii]|uniref:Cell division protein ZapA n=1 Tax=Methylomarinovum caldicuralii TaxID=438856 RepID=A0AAU9CT43_9GAMM|nr:cell division protein ZapA [Methylomarinovum caldicuralii]BCX81082.1 cell division protein ZapA [Methylomarinovum caldicuralii]